MFSVGASCPVHSCRRMSLSSAWLGSTSSAGVRQFRFPDTANGGRIRRNYAWKAKAEYFGVDLKTEVSVESESIEPGVRIKGNLVIDTKFPIEHDGIFIELEAFCSLNYSTKHQERNVMSVHKGKGCILENTKLNPFGHLESPIKCEIIPITPPEFGGHSINSGVWHYPFQLAIPSDPILPAPFQNSHGNLDYRLVVYMISHSSATYVKLADKGMRCDLGHYNLYDVEEASKPIVIEQYYRKSYFSQKKLVKATFTVESTGFLQLEEIPFSIFIKNPKCSPLHVSVAFLQHVKYQASSELTSAVKIVTNLESLEKDESEDEFNWDGRLHVPDGLPPSYTCNSMYGVSYLVEFQVKSLDELIITGQANILLGTGREPLKSAAEPGSGELQSSSGELHRSGSESSIHSQRSIYSTTISYSVPANLNLSVDEPSDDDDEEEFDEDIHRGTGSGDAAVACSSSSSVTTCRQTDDQSPSTSSSSQRNRTEHDQPQDDQQHEDTITAEETEEGITHPSLAPFPLSSTASNSSLHSTETRMSLPPSYSQLSSRIPSTETLPPTYADLDLDLESLGPSSSTSLLSISGGPMDLEKRYAINLDSLSIEDEYQVTFYSV